MKIAIFGTGYVGLVTGTCLAELGNDVVCVDIMKEKIDMLKRGEVPIYEPGLQEMIHKNSEEGRLVFTTNAKRAIEDQDIIFISVGTPQAEDGEADLRAIFAVAETIGKYMNSYKVVATKSTVPVGTNHKIKDIISEYTQDFDIASIPEFLKEGTAIKDFMTPDRVVIGVESERAEKMLKMLFRDLERIYKPLFVTDVKSAEMIKYAANSLLAMKISFINEVANLCEKAGADISSVYEGIALDTRIGPRFLQSGIGYGGSCFPKDVRALIKTGEYYGSDFFLLEAVDKVNKRQRYVAVDKVERLLGGDVKGKTIAVFGLAFKPRTDDIRESPAIDIIRRLKAKGAIVKTYDPVAMPNTIKDYGEDFAIFTNDALECATDAEAVILATEWDVFRGLSRQKLKDVMVGNIMVDGRNIYNKEAFVQDGFIFEGIGR